MSQLSGMGMELAPGDLCLLTTYFNPAGFKRKLGRYLDFASRCAASGLPLFTMECAFGEGEFEIPVTDRVSRVRARDTMWQKERLLNLLLERVPKHFTKIVSVDFDGIFDNPRWAIETSCKLDEVPLVQPFDTAIWLPRNASVDDGTGRVMPGVVSRVTQDPSVIVRGDFVAHGHTGFAWAARRSLLEVRGHYDACVIGGGDHLIAHAAFGDWTSGCFDWTLGTGTPHLEHFARWASAFDRDVRRQVGFVAGKFLHLWHGPWKNRRYASRHLPFKTFDFDPEKDIRLDSNGCWEWASDKPALHAAVAAYFRDRQEDGDDV